MYNWGKWFSIKLLFSKPLNAYVNPFSELYSYIKNVLYKQSIYRDQADWESNSGLMSSNSHSIGWSCVNVWIDSNAVNNACWKKKRKQ